MGRLIRQGTSGADVRAVQDVLNFHIRRLAPLVVDGSFGPATHGRVMEFQKSNGLKQDGIVGQNTLGKLFEEELVPITVAIVIPLMGLLEEPINPTIRDDTVTNKAPKMITNIPISNFCSRLSPGTCGSIAISATSTRLPMPTTFILMSFSVLKTAVVSPSLAWLFLIELILPLIDLV
ncbi:MAG: peptidoglycan-binding domain-containing protein, partial [Ramlibacter sp.]